MSVLSHDAFAAHETVTFITDPEAGLRAIVAIHDTTRGPALGGCRMYAYGSEEEALRDVLRLSRGMTYKAAAANLSLGGGKAVIIGNPRELKAPALMRAMGRAVDRLGGNYITAEDVGTTVADFAEVRKETRFVVGAAHRARWIRGPFAHHGARCVFWPPGSSNPSLESADAGGLHGRGSGSRQRRLASVPHAVGGRCAPHRERCG